MRSCSMTDSMAGGEFAVRGELQVFLVSRDGLFVLLQPLVGSAEQFIKDGFGVGELRNGFAKGRRRFLILCFALRRMTPSSV